MSLEKTLSELRFCPRCAGPLEWRAVQYPQVRHPVCTACGFVLWQNPKPCVDALIVRGDAVQTEVLLGRRAEEPSRGLWDLPGGFLNVGDHLEAALGRECQREIGVEIRVRELLGVFDSEFLGTQTVTLVFVCDLLAGDPGGNDIVDQVEWFLLVKPPTLAFPVVAQAIAELRRRLQV